MMMQMQGKKHQNKLQQIIKRRIVKNQIPKVLKALLSRISMNNLHNKNNKGKEL